MRLPLTLILLLLSSQPLLAATPAKRSYSTHDYYVLEHSPSAGASLDECARALGVEVVEQAGELWNHWLVRRPKPDAPLSRRTTDDVLESLDALRTLSSPHSSLSSRSEERQHAKRISSSVKYLAPQVPRQRVKRAPPPITPGSEDATTSRAIADRLGIEDPSFTQQWHIVNDEFPQHMMNVTGLWENGITGNGIISTLVDDGLDYTSDDLASNFYAPGSYDFNDHEDLPTPKLFDDHHGTRCAGQIAAVKNDVCGVGLAYDSKVAGVRILSGPISDVDEAASLNYGYHETSIYSCSWGPADDGRSMEAPGYLIQKAVVNGIQNGRDGKGSIFVFASGNGAAHDDQCNFDGYTNSIYSITVSAIDYKGLHPYYSESCAANMIVAYSSGSGHSITTTDVGKNKCATTHGGTSAAAPNAVGVFALALSVRPDLTWRDFQHLCVRTAEVINADDPDWEKTATGRPFSYKYGYGRLNGEAFVNAAQDWESVKPQAWIQMAPVQIADGRMTAEGEMSGGEQITADGLTSSVQVTKEMLDRHNFEKLEHVNVKVWIEHSRRGDVEVELVSPNGVKSILAGMRKFDSANSGFLGWTFMSVKHWDEDPLGDWTIRVKDQGKADESGNFLGWSLTLWGSTIDPAQAKLYQVPPEDSSLPPTESPEDEEDPSTTTLIATSTKSHPKPTEHLPGDHGEAEGEADRPAFSNGGSSTPTATEDPEEDVAEPEETGTAPESSESETMTPTPDEGWFPDMSNLISNSKWFFAAIGAVALFGISAGIFFWRRRVAQKRNRGQYTTLSAGDDVAMSSISGDASAAAGARTRTKELYDAFGEVSDDEDADEETGLTGGRLDRVATSGLGFHSGFLEDDDPESATPSQPFYRDEPDEAERAREAEAEGHSLTPDSRSRSPGSSGDGSWEHASQTR